MRTSQKTPGLIATIGIDLSKNTFHLVGFNKRGAIVLQQKVSRAQLERRLANIPRCPFMPLWLPKFRSGRIRKMRQNQRIIAFDARDPPFACSICRRSV